MPEPSSTASALRRAGDRRASADLRAALRAELRAAGERLSALRAELRAGRSRGGLAARAVVHLTHHAGHHLAHAQARSQAHAGAGAAALVARGLLHDVEGPLLLVL